MHNVSSSTFGFYINQPIFLKIIPC